MVVKLKESFEKTRQVKNTFYEDIEIQDIMKKYQIKKNLIISFLFLIQHNFIISQLSSGAANNISERLTGRKPVRNKVTSERVYCRIISVGRAIARSYCYYPQYTILFMFICIWI